MDEYIKTMDFPLSEYDKNVFFELGCELLADQEKSVEIKINLEHTVKITCIRRSEGIAHMRSAFLRCGRAFGEITTSYHSVKGFAIRFFKNLDFIWSFIRCAENTAVIEVLKTLSFEVLLKNDVLIPASVFDNKGINDPQDISCLKYIAAKNGYRFIRKSFYYALAMQVIYEKDLKYEPGILRKIVDQDVINGIDQHYFFKNDLNYKKLKEASDKKLKALVHKAQYGGAAIERDRFGDLVRSTMLNSWPAITSFDAAT